MILFVAVMVFVGAIAYALNSSFVVTFCAGAVIAVIAMAVAAPRRRGRRRSF